MLLKAPLRPSPSVAPAPPVGGGPPWVALLKAVRDLQRRRLRSALTLLAIVIGVAGVVSISFTGRTLTAAQALAVQDASQADLTLPVWNASPTTVDIIRRSPHLTAVASRTVLRGQWSAGGKWLDARIVGLNNYVDLTVNRVELVEGRLPGPDEFLLDGTARSFWPVALGEIVAFRTDPSQPVVYLRLSGYSRTPSAIDATILNLSTVYTRGEVARRLIQAENDNRLLFRLVAPERRAAGERDILNVLDKRRVWHGGFWVNDPANQPGRRELETLLLLMQVFSALGIVLSGSLVANTMATLMTEEMRQIGIMKALGGPTGHVALPYLASATLLGLAGAGLGLLGGVAGGQLLATYLGGFLSLELPPLTADAREPALALAVGLGVTLAAALLPLWHGVRLPTGSLLRNYGVQASYRRGPAERLARWLGQGAALPAMALRNCARRPQRTAIVTAAVAAGTAAYLATQVLSLSVNATVNELYGLYAADAWVWFGQPVRTVFARDLARQPGVVAAEPWQRATAFTRGQRADLWGLPVDTRLYQYRLVRGRWLAEGAAEVVVSDLFARRQEIAIGQPLVVEVDRRTRVLTVVGTVDDESLYLGSTTAGKLFVTSQAIASLTGSGDQAGFFAIRLADSTPTAVDRVLADLQQEYKRLSPGMVVAYEDREASLRAVRILSLMLTAMVIIIGAIAAVGIANTLAMNVMERRREFGILRAIGGGAADLARLLALEALLIGLAGAVIGLGLGYPLARLLVGLTGDALFQLTFTLPLDVVLTTLALAVLLALAAALGPGLGAARLRVGEAIRYE
jgi:putative ABC transport system permease protein